MSNKPYQRRTPAQWQAIVDDFIASGLSGAQYCRQNKIHYASFSKWRQRLLAEEPAHQTQESNQVNSSFVDLSALASHTSVSWHITLRLGNGVELVLSQA